MRETSKQKAFGGHLHFFTHASKQTATDMNVSVYVPCHPEKKKLPALLWLSGLTCNEHNFIQKAGALKKAQELGFILICPDTSPRGAGVEGEDSDWDLGTGAGFYLDATQPPWNKYYKMESYLVRELLPALASSVAYDPDKLGILGHSMGGHGAITLAIKHPKIFHSVSAFAPICHPTDCPWGIKAFTQYLGDDKESWKLHDACELINLYGFDKPILVDQGTADQFLEEQLKPEALIQVCKEKGVKLEFQNRTDYDHSYYFIASFIENHLKWHFDKLHA